MYDFNFMNVVVSQIKLPLCVYKPVKRHFPMKLSIPPSPAMMSVQSPTQTSPTHMEKPM